MHPSDTRGRIEKGGKLQSSYCCPENKLSEREGVINELQRWFQRFSNRGITIKYFTLPSRLDIWNTEKMHRDFHEKSI